MLTRLMKKKEECILLAHEAQAFSSGTSALAKGEIPDLSIYVHHQTLLEHEDPKSVRVKGDELGEEMKPFYEIKFIPTNWTGNSVLKQLVAGQMLENMQRLTLSLGSEVWFIVC